MHWLLGKGLPDLLVHAPVAKQVCNFYIFLQ